MTSEIVKSLMKGKALEIYERMDEGDKAVIAFGMTPSWAADELEEFMSDFEYESKEVALAFMYVADMPGNVNMVV
jgi:hypothetical protein